MEVMEGGVAIVDIKIVVVIEEVEGVEGAGHHLPVLILQEEGASEALAVVSCMLRTLIPTVLQVIVDLRGWKVGEDEETGGMMLMKVVGVTVVVVDLAGVRSLLGDGDGGSPPMIKTKTTMKKDRGLWKKVSENNLRPLL